MKLFDIFSATAEFRRLKLFLGLGMILLTVLIYIAAVALPGLASDVLSYVMLPVWAGLSIGICRKIYHSVGYRVDAGHLAIITGTVAEGYPPKDMISFASDMVTQRFRTEKQYFHAKKLISGAVNELNTVFTRASSLVGEVPGMKMMVAIGRMFLRLQLYYMTHCCIGYTFFRGDEGLYLSATEGCAIFSINWKQLTKNATDISIFLTAAITILTAALGIGLYSLLNLVGAGKYAYAGVILAFLLVLLLKYVYVDTLLTIYYVNLYMHYAAYSAPSPAFFMRLEKLSPSFARMASLANGKFPQPSKPRAFDRLRKKNARRVLPGRMPDQNHTLICPRCRSANLREAKFCAVCGTQLKFR